MPEPRQPETRPDAPLEAGPGYDRAFAVTDALAVHSAQCVCPRCAGRLPGLLAELARALDGAPPARR